MSHHRLRHRVPTILSLSMLDFFCCSLGVVLLLMLLNIWDVRHKAQILQMERDRVGKASTALAKVEKELATLRILWEQANQDVQAKEKALAALQSQLRSSGEKLEQTQGQLARLRQDRDTTSQQLADVQKKQTLSQSEIAGLKNQLAEKEERLSDLSKLLDTTTKARDAASGQSVTLSKDLEKAKARALTLETDLQKLQQQAKEAGLKLAEAEKSAKSTQQDAASLRKMLDEQQAASGRLRSELTIAQNRFAGVDLSGKRVICLVDMSGSMGAVDSQNVSTQKWPEVCNTVAQVLRSLPDVERFQVLIFSDEVKYLLGQQGQWLVFDRASSADTVKQALLKVKPDGNTALYAAFQEAFRFQPQGLDSIFLFSDGLPNTGPGLPLDPPRDEAAQGAILGKHLLDTIRQQWNRGPTKVKIHSIGFFYESPNLGAFLWALSRENGGSFVGMSKP